MRRLCLIVCSAVAVAAAASLGVSPPTPAAAAASTWTNSATSGPAAQAGASMAWDQATGTDVLLTTSGQTWTWDGSAWTQQHPATSPSARTGAAMAYDAIRGVVVLFGGVSGSTYLGDTWSWNGTTWTSLQSTLSPPARAGASMAWDTRQGRMMLFGGYQDVGIFYGDTWTWDGTTWNELVVNFVTVGAGPAPRTQAQMSDDPANGTVVLFGGTSPQGVLNDTWVWYDSPTGDRWFQDSPVVTPTARFQGTLAYASRADAQAPILFGGNTSASGSLVQDTWTWDGAGWAQGTPGGQPPARSSAASAAGPNGTVVIFGGYGSSGLLGDTWTWAGAADAAPLAPATIVSCPVAPGPSGSTYALPTTSGSGTLRGAAAVSHPGLLIGASLTADQVTDADALEQTTAGSQFNLIASSNQMYWSADAPQPGVFNFCDGDQFVGLAQAYHQSLRLHNLVAGNQALGQTPNWVISPTTPWTSTSLSAVMKQYITAVIDHYRGKVSVFDVVNEALDPGGNPSVNVFQQVIGYPRYVELAFQYAHDANPQATLLYDDYLNWFGNKNTAFNALIQDLKSNSYVDAVGFEMFYSGAEILPGSGSPQSADLATAMSNIASLGVKTAITQMTAPMELNPSSGILSLQSSIYNYVMSACLAPASNCFMFMTWGVSDTYDVPTTLVASGTGFQTASYGGDLFDEAYQPRPAFNRVLALLQ